jgi:uncharacterized protein YbjT (DUF2867 family)
MILVTGATGNNGVELIKRLSATGAPVRGMVHKRRDDANLGLPGVEFVAADFDEPETIRRALDGVDRAFLVTNSTESAEARQLRFVELARAAGVQQIVYLSQLHAATNSPVRFLRYHAVVEDAIRSSGMMFTNLRPNLYMQGMLAFRQSIESEGRFYAAAGDARVSIVDVRDIAAVAAAALTESGHSGKRYDLTGPEALTHAEMASQLSEALRTVTMAGGGSLSISGFGANRNFGFPTRHSEPASQVMTECQPHYPQAGCPAVCAQIRWSLLFRRLYPQM